MHHEAHRKVRENAEQLKRSAPEKFNRAVSENMMNLIAHLGHKPLEGLSTDDLQAFCELTQEVFQKLERREPEEHRFIMNSYQKLLSIGALPPVDGTPE